MTITKYSFEILKNFPTERRYLIKMPLRKSLLDSFVELFGAKK